MRMGLWAALAACLTWAAPQVGHAQDAGAAAFAAFRDACISGNGDADYAVGKLRGRGWVAGPEEMTMAMRQETGPETVVLLNFNIETLAPTTADDIGPALAMVGVAPQEAFDGMPVTGPFCGIAPLSGEVRSVRRGFEAYYPFPPFDSEGSVLWVFTLEDGVPVAAKVTEDQTDEEGLALIRERPHFAAGIQQEEDMTILLFIRFVP